MADRYTLDKHPHFSYIGEKLAETLSKWWTFFKSPDFQYHKDRRTGITMRVGDIDNDTYFEIEDDGFFRLVETVAWEDLRVPISGVRLPAANAPTWIAYKGSQVLAFDGTSTDTIFFVAQMPHTYKEASDIKAHVHWVPEDNTAGNVKWQFTYSWVGAGAAFPSETTVTKIGATPEVTDQHTITNIVDITAIDDGTSSMILCSLARLGSDPQDTYDAKDVYLLEVDFHFQKDTLGSRQELVK